MRRIFLAAMMFGAATAAHAADMPDFLRGSLPAGPAPVANWQGWYIGGQGSYGTDTAQVSPSLNNDLRAQPVPPPGFHYTWANLSQAKDVAPGYGAFAGYNAQWDDVVAGFEANYMHTNYAALTTAVGVDPTGAITTSRALVSLTDFGSIRLRAGYAIGCFLPYLYAGAGLGSQTIDRSVSAVPTPVNTATFSNTKDSLVYGYSAGFGVDVLMTAGLFMRAEYEYQRVTASTETTINSGRLGIGYKF
jgi:opacity protein-like surface antigen